MDEAQVIDGIALFTQLGTAVYSLRLNRVLGTDRAGWALFGAFALMLAMHVNQAWEVSAGLSSYDLKPQFVYLVISALLLIGLTHVGVLFRDRIRVEQMIRRSRDELEERIQERTRELEEVNDSLQAEINERKKAEAQIRASETRYQALLDSVDCIVFEAEGNDLHFTFVSPQCQRLLGYPTSHWLNQGTWQNLVHPDDSPTVVPACLDGIRSHTNSTLEFRAVAADGHEVWLRQLTTVMTGQDGALRIRGVLLDITERQTMELQLRQVQKLESIGRLAGGVAHGFNNMLTVIQGHAAFLLTMRDLPALVGESLRQIHLATDRASGLTAQLLAFGRRQTMKPQLLELNEVVSNVMKMLRHILGDDVVLHCQGALAPVTIKADLGMIEQVLLNLAVNARDAMPHGGELTMATSVVQIAEDYVADGVRFRAGPYALLVVRDTGCGISPEVLPRIFEPFFTTKEVGKGTGLGLATAYGIIRQHQGWMQVDSAVHRGATFKLYLPVVCESEPNRAASELMALPCGGETVLVVDDEAAVRELVCDVLKRYEYQVLSAESGVAALKAWREQSERIDLLLTDIMMPGGIDGWELADRLRADKPDLRVICLSGYNPDILRADCADAFVTKPFQAQHLIDAVRRALTLERK
jgi:two-component system, cell cycle sensor histidine kinase and response regulator CckA